MKFEEFLQQKHAERYRRVDDDMEEDYERWIMELEIEQIIQFAEEWHMQESVKQGLASFNLYMEGKE